MAPYGCCASSHVEDDTGYPRRSQALVQKLCRPTAASVYLVPRPEDLQASPSVLRSRLAGTRARAFDVSRTSWKPCFRRRPNSRVREFGWQDSRLCAQPCIWPMGRTNGMRRHFPFQPIRYLVWIKADGRSHSEEWNVIVLHFLVESSYRNAKNVCQFFDRQGFLLRPQLLDESHFVPCEGSANERTESHFATGTAPPWLNADECLPL